MKTMKKPFGLIAVACEIYASGRHTSNLKCNNKHPINCICTFCNRQNCRKYNLFIGDFSKFAIVLRTHRYILSL